ncbi:integrase catalytic subunit [Raoultella terrigena]|nr:integrase catalytic subunit [Raoultella terrigena]
MIRIGSPESICKPPHESLNNLTPEEYRLMAETPKTSKKCVELKRVCLHRH